LGRPGPVDRPRALLVRLQRDDHVELTLTRGPPDHPQTSIVNGRDVTERSLLVHDLGGVLVTSVDEGDVIRARDDGHAIDISLGLGDAVTLAAAPSTSVPHLHLETYLPALADDARQAIALLHRSNSLTKAAETDPLTGLANRRTSDRVVESLAVGAAVAVIDLDPFKAWLWSSDLDRTSTLPQRLR
jgi:hypothetical protein